MWKQFYQKIARPINGAKNTDRVSDSLKLVRFLLQSMCLRRTKHSLIDGKPILNLPARNIEFVNVSMSGDEHKFYESVEQRTRLRFNTYVRSGTVTKNYANILVLLLRLRQACDHPLINMDVEDRREEEYDIARQFSPNVIERISESITSAVECPICMDVGEHSMILYPCGHIYCSECLARHCDSMAQMIEKTCPACRGVFRIEKCVPVQVFKEVHNITGNDQIAEEEEAVNEGTVKSEGATHDAKYSEIKAEGVKEDDADKIEIDGDGAPALNKTEHGLKLEELPGTTSDMAAESSAVAHARAPGAVQYKDIQAAERLMKTVILEQRKVGGHVSRARFRNMLDSMEKHSDNGRGAAALESAKLQKIRDIVSDMLRNHSGDKMVIFSQFTAMLDLIGRLLERMGVRSVRYDGAMNINERTKSVELFNKRLQEPYIMLISTKCGSLGLNLTWCGESGHYC